MLNPMFTHLLAQFCSPPTPEGKYLALYLLNACVIVLKLIANFVCLPFGAEQASYNATRVVKVNQNSKKAP